MASCCPHLEGLVIRANITKKRRRVLGGTLIHPIALQNRRDVACFANDEDIPSARSEHRSVLTTLRCVKPQSHIHIYPRIPRR